MKVVLLHALPLDERMWDPQREALSEFDLETPRLYGRGNAIDTWATTILESIEGDVVAVGASMGGYCALALARLAPDRVQGVALLGSRADPDSEERRAGRAETLELIAREGPEGLWRAMRPRLFPPDAAPEVVDRARALAIEQDPASLAAAVEAIRDRRDATNAARSLGEGLLIAVGDRDPFVDPDYARQLAAEAGGRAEIFRNTGHMPSLERPEELNRVLREFLYRWR